MRKFFFCTTALLIASGAPILALAAAGPPLPGEPALVVSYPWGIPADQAVAAAGLSEIAPLSAPMGALTALEREEDAHLLKRLGVWLVIDGRKVSVLCGI